MSFAPVPLRVRQCVLGWFGEAGERWLAGLPDSVANLQARWHLRPAGEPYSGGSHSYVLPVERADGSPAVLKVIYVDDENRAEPTALRAYDGQGAIRLYEYDPADGSMLLERAEPGVALWDHRFPGMDETAAAWHRIEIACQVYRRLWRPYATPEPGYPEIPKVSNLLTEWEALYGRPPAQVRAKLGPMWIDRALGLCADLRDTDEEGIGNRDTHLANLVSAEREEWLLLDPKPYLADRAFDGGYFLFKQQFHGPLGGPAVARAVAAGLGADIERVRAWAVLRGLEVALEETDALDPEGVMAATEAIWAS